MYKLTNLLLKLFVLLAVAVGGINSAWADRVAPEFVSQVDITSKWYQLFFVNSGGEYGYVYRNATDGRMLRTQNSTAGSATNYFWQFVGAGNDFVLINYDGYYAKYDNTRYVTTSVQAEATHFSIVENTTNGNDCWGIRRNGGQFWNPQNQEGQRQIREYSNNDGGARLRFIPQDVSSFVPLQAKDPTTFAQLQDGWYAITVAQAGGDPDMATAVTAGRRGIVPNPVPANMEAEGNTLYGLNVVTPHANPGLNLVHVTKEGSNTYIQSLFGLYFNTSNQAQYAKTNENNPTITGNLSNVKFGNWHTFHNGAAIGNNSNSNIYTLTPYVLDSELAAQTAPVTIYRVESSGKAVPTYNAGNTYTNRNSLPTVTCRNTAVLRSEATVGLGGYFIFSNGYVPSAADFEVHDIGLDNFDVEVTGTGAIKTLRFMTAGEPWKVIITGDKRDDEQITYRNNLKFSTHQPSILASGEESATVGDGGYFYFNTGITREQLLDCDFTSNAASRGAGKSFVYGPVIDMTAHTITCEIREAITAMPATEGWYQLKYDVSTGNNVAATNRYTNADEGNSFTIPTRSARRFYPTMPLGGISGRSEYLEYGTYPTDATTPQTFFKLIPSSGGLKVMSIDGRYVSETGVPSTTPTYTNPASYVDGEVDFRHWYPFPTYNYMLGKSTNTHNYFYTAPAKFDDNRYEFYEVHIEADQVANDARVTYSGSTTNYSKNDVYRNGFFVFPKGHVPNKSEFTVNGATFSNMTMEIAEAGGIKTLTFKEAHLQMGDRVTVRIVDQHNATVEGASVYFVKPDKSRMELTATGGTYDLSDYEFHANSFVGSDDYLLLHVDYNTDTQELTFTVAEFTPEWYIINHGYSHNDKYLSSDYVASNGNLNFQAAKPNNYAGIWMIQNLTGGGLNFANAKYYASKIITVTNNNVSRMDDINAIRTGAVYEVTKVANGNKWRFPTVADATKYLGMSGFQVEVRAATTDGSIDMTLERIPNLGKHVTIRVTDADGGVLSQGNVVYRSQREDIPAVATLLTNGETYNFGNVPYLSSLFEDSPTCHLLEVAYDEEQALLTFKVNQVPVTNWTIRITNDAGTTPNTTNTVFFKEVVQAKNGDRMALPEAIQHIDFTIDAPADKFVWGPVINKASKVVTYDVRDLATALEAGWYQMQIADDAVAALSGEIVPKNGNMNTKASTLYLAPALYSQTSDILKATGVPQYAGEASTFVYIENKGGDNYSLTSPVTGQSIEGTFTFSDGVLTKSGGWSYETIAQPLEGPFLQTSGSSSPSFKVSAANISDYTVYKVSIKQGETVASDVRLNIGTPNVLGSTIVGNGGYLFMRKGSNVPVLSQASVTSGNVTVTDITTEENDGVTTVIFHVATKQTMWKAVITGGAANLETDHVIYGDDNFKNGESIALIEGYEPTALEFKTNVTDRFVWGPVIDRENKTVTFEVRNVVDEITPGNWYQIQFREKDVQYFDGSFQSTKKNIVNVVNEAVTTPVRYKGPYIYAINPPGTGYPLELTGVMPDGNDVNTYLYVAARNGNNVTIQNQNGIYVQNTGANSTSSSASIPLTINNGTHAFTWNSNTIPWSRTQNASYITIGNTGSAQSGNIEMFFHPVSVKAYKITGTGGNKVEYTGSAKVIGSKMVADGRFLFLEGDQTLEGEGSTIDASKFTLMGGISTITGISAATTGGYTTLTFTTTAPSYTNTIIHRQHDVYDRIATVSDDLLPKGSHIKRGEGMMAHPMKDKFTAENTDNDKLIQNTSVFHVTQYTKPGTRTECVLPFTKGKSTGDHLRQYQRWYNYLTERPLADEIIKLDNGNSTLGNLNVFTNGHCNYNTSGARQHDVLGKADIKLPADSVEIYVGVDASEYRDSKSLGNGNILEPSLNMRVIYHIISAHEMAKKLQVYNAAEPIDTWWEAKEYFVPNIKRGSDTYKNNADIIPLDMPYCNYWIYKASGNTDDSNLMPIVPESGNGSNYNTLRSNIEIVVEGTAKDYLEVGVLDGNPGNIGNAPYISSNHFLYYKVKGSGVTRTVPAGSQAVIKVYAKDGSNSNSPKYQLFKFTLNFQAATEPLAITSVVGNPASTRSVDYFIQNGFKESASLTFQNKDVTFTKISGYRENQEQNEGVTYAFPIDFSRTSYGYSPFNTFGNYRITTRGYGIQYRPVSLYERNIKNRTNTSMQCADDYFFYIDAAESPGQVASITLDGTLCPGSRLFCYGWIGSTNYYNGQGAPYAASVLLQLIGRRSNGTEEVIASYLPGTLTDVSYDDEGDEMRSLTNAGFPSQQQAGWMDLNATQVGVWNNVGFSFVVKDVDFSSYDLRIINNCFSTQGGDYVLDDFRVFVSPPKGSVDFTTPLCSDKVRHAKVHTDFDMLLSASGVNETDPGAKLSVSYCFLDADVFDNYREGDLTIKNIFEVDEQTGNHNLKHEYADNDNIIKLINNAFGAALVGTRKLAKDDPEDCGFHTFNISTNYESLPKYAYNDSKNEEVYREETDNGTTRRIVLKEDVVRDEMKLIEDGGQKRYPHMRPSTTYYLVFSPFAISEGNITQHNVATEVFEMHESCSFFGKFTTKDPMHVILDNADIESDLPITAVCYDEKKEFHFDMPALKLDKPIVDEAYCISEENLNGKIVPSTQGAHHYKYEASFNNDDVYGVIKNLPYDWWMGGLKFDDETKYRGTIDDYLAAKHPTYKYNHDLTDPNHKHTHAEDYKKHGEPVDISLAMEDFRFYYPDFNSGDDWSTLVPHDYNNDSGYSLLQSEINAIQDLVEKGIILLNRNTYDMPLTYKEAEELQAQEVNDLTEDETSNRILKLALKLNEDKSIASTLPLKAIEGTVLEMISPAGRLQLTLEELGSFTHEQLKGIATALKTKDKLTDVTAEQIDAMSEGDLRRAVEKALKAMTDEEMQTFASNESNFPNIGHEKRAYLVVRALDILSRETVADLMKEKPNATTAEIRAALRAKMIELFSQQKPVVLRKMWADTSAELTEAERIALLTKEGKDGKPATILNPAEMNDAAELAVLVEDALAKIVNNVIDDMKSDRYIHFTLVPIMPSQENFVDEPYIFCPDPRGVKIRITNKKPQMFDGFADMPYPDDMDNVPVRIGLQQIKAVPYDEETVGAKTLRIPLRRLGRAQTDGERDQIEVNEHGYGSYLFLVETNDPAYKREGATADPKTGLTKAALLEVANSEDDYPADAEDEIGRHHLIGRALNLQAIYSDQDNFMDVQLNPDFNFREGYTYRVGFNFVESKRMLNSKGEVVTNPETGEIVYERNQSCFGTMQIDMKIVPEYQKWTGAVSDDWTNDANWQRADRSDLHADNDDASVSVALADATDIRNADLYATNVANQTTGSFIPMAFTNTLIAEGADRMPSLYNVIPAHHPYKDSDDNVVEGAFAVLNAATATDKAKYDMEVYDATGEWNAKDNYECGLFGTYVAKGITFEPATSLYNAQLLSYQKAWVEYSLNTNRWYTIASPLQGTFSGEWYSPTGSDDDKGKQLTPHFYGINYDVALNNRFNPAYYQRSWDQGTAKMFRCYDTNHNPEDFYMSDVENKSPLNVALALDWSHVYNDVKVDYSNGGFSVKPVFDDDSDGEVLVRMPKADDSYFYFDKGDETIDETHRGDETPIARGAGHYRLFSDKLATAESFSQSVTNANGAENPYYLVANPFMAPMDIDKFFDENPQFEAGKYWIMTDNLQSVNVKTGSGWISTTGDDAQGAVAPLQAFFVKKAVPAAGKVTVTYTAAMQKALATVPALKAPAQQSSSSLSSSLVFHIEATNADGALQSQAAVAFSETATNAYRAGEDAELLLDGNTAEEIATVFTAAPTTEMGEAQAMQFNVLSRSVTMIPLGVIAPTDETETTLTFTGLAALADVMAEAPYLYDAANGSFTALDEETTLTVTGTSAGRYFIVSGMTLPYGNDDDNDNDNDNGESLKTYNLHGIRVATPQRGNVTIRGSRKEYRR